MTDSTKSEPVNIACFSDVLCVWAYVAQIRIDELGAVWGKQLHIGHHFINLFGAAEHRIGEGWRERGGYEAFGDHVIEVCRQFPHLEIHPAVWRRCRPQGSASAHLLLKAVQQLEDQQELPLDTTASLAWQIRLAFFRDARDISDWRELQALAGEHGIDPGQVNELTRSGAAIAALVRDQELRQQYHIPGSPTYLLNNGRQTLFGNVGYRILEANVRELLEQPDTQASWC